MTPAVPTIKARNETKEDGDEEYDQSCFAQEKVKEESDCGFFTHIFIPFSSSSPIKGAYISIRNIPGSLPPLYLVFTVSSSKGEKVSKKYEFPEFEEHHWYFFPVDLFALMLFCV
ncbi:hypothetical protein ADUPG1_012767 [Aduncisulcus paluster]|uniref:Uncharacterized protein n=1 Tax=Aduncisulcus paluster TaxID=2918883 RepID=A0ABQ5K3T9_9EUKA|nr:hypothetical protein ADUPG1_012767 [Aduncisulcus paluster]